MAIVFQLLRVEILAHDQRQQFDQMHGAPIQFAREDLRLELRSRGG